MKYVFDLGMDGSWVTSYVGTRAWGLTMRLDVGDRPLLLVTLVLQMFYQFVFLGFFKPQNPVFLEMNFVLLHFEMGLVIRLGFYSSCCCCNYNLCLTLFGGWLPRKRKRK